MIRLVCIIEVESAHTITEAQRELDRFRESVQLAKEYGLVIYQANGDTLEGLRYDEGLAVV